MQIETDVSPGAAAYDEIESAPTRFRPTDTHLVVLPLNPDATTKGGLYIPDVHRERPQLARVLARGPNVECAEVGDTVLFAKYGGHEITEAVEIPAIHEHEDQGPGLQGRPAYTAERNVLVLPETQVLAVLAP